MRTCFIASCLLGFAFSVSHAQTPTASSETQPLLVGRWREDFIVTPVNQLLTPYGTQVELPGLRPQVLALSPDGRLLVTSGKTSELVSIDPESGEIRQRVGLPSEQQNEPQPQQSSANILKPDGSGQVSYTGLIFSPDGRRIYLSNVNGSVKVFTVGVDEASTIAPSHTYLLPAAAAPRRAQEIPSG